MASFQSLVFGCALCQPLFQNREAKSKKDKYERYGWEKFKEEGREIKMEEKSEKKRWQSQLKMKTRNLRYFSRNKATFCPSSSS